MISHKNIRRVVNFGRGTVGITLQKDLGFKPGDFFYIEKISENVIRIEKIKLKIEKTTSDGDYEEVL